MVLLKTLIFTVVMPGTVGVILPLFLLRGSGDLTLPIPSIWMVGVVPLTLGAALYFWCAGAFTFIGKGTPAPIDAPKVLVIQGPYRWVRNPMYVAVLLVVLGEAILFHSIMLVVYALLFWFIVHSFVVLVEEPSLQAQFGASYETYRRVVPRWIPRLSQ